MRSFAVRGACMFVTIIWTCPNVHRVEIVRSHTVSDRKAMADDGFGMIWAASSAEISLQPARP